MGGLCEFLTAKQDAEGMSVSVFRALRARKWNDWQPLNTRLDGAHIQTGRRDNKKYLPLTGIETGHLGLRSVNLNK